MAKRNQKPEVRKAQRKHVIRAAKEAKKAKQASKKTAMAAAKVIVRLSKISHLEQQEDLFLTQIVVN